ncbi:uncharacterized protein LOC110452886 isoform X1 [Mizuhopecten yessoensis]|uniref:Uncharacterized protein n=1 Tax=Mizuhopecten yessoensis TaxID=6573 RepID=A0A210QIH2_MIZYE|nr:uncharacterized protein LOC110452886 isoform X1 [Mizuhopecten yessoensis]OWF48588.1 hypothetical protein KP79_PYT04511 [Mizuhopecten yessoensis]
MSLGVENGRTSDRRRSSVWNPITIDAEDLNGTEIDKDAIRRSVFGPRLSEVNLGAIDTSVCRPTAASARRSVLWSRERKSYESLSKQNLQEFRERPYMKYRYPELSKHYPGTWRTANSQQLQKIVDRLTRPTSLSTMRAQSAPKITRTMYSSRCSNRSTTTQSTVGSYSSLESNGM